MSWFSWRWRLSWGCLFLMLTGCENGRFPLSEEAVRNGLVGTWVEHVREGGLEASMLKTYRANGTATGRIRMVASNGKTHVHEPETHFEDRWRVVGDVIETYDIQSNQPDIYPPGTVLHDRVVSISADEVRLFDLDNRASLRLKRASAADLKEWQ